MNPLYPAAFAAGVLVGFTLFDRLNAYRLAKRLAAISARIAAGRKAGS